MKINYDKKLLTYSIYVIFTVISIFIAITLMSNIGLIFKTSLSLLTSFFSLIKPLLIALVISYLLYPITKYLEKVFKDNTKKIWWIKWTYRAIVWIFKNNRYIRKKYKSFQRWMLH